MVQGVNWQTVITIVSLITALFTLYKYFANVVRWIDKQKQQDQEIFRIKEEQTVIVYGVLACLKGLAEKGCNGPVHDAIEKIEKHLNLKAHS